MGVRSIDASIVAASNKTGNRRASQASRSRGSEQLADVKYRFRKRGTTESDRRESTLTYLRADVDLSSTRSGGNAA
jgi:hypothetical protein